ncbi:MAG: tRNA (N(6)-L-threonylcarbamoyladenosine(37)-C(2))-methylthiotransferase MtaB [Bacteroidota bacterium]
MKTVAIHTLGCKLNFAESSTIMRQFENAGYSIIDFDQKADIFIIHSCIVTQQAERKCISTIRQAAKRNPKAQIAVLGCMPELNKERLLEENNKLLLLGNNQKFSVLEILSKGDTIIDNQSEIFQPSYSSGSRTRTFLKIQDGCDYFCSYCTIPSARGNSRSANIEETIKYICEATCNGCKELVLTGINIGDFGKKHSESLLNLLIEIGKIDKIKRVRLSSIEPDLLSDEIIELFATSEKFMPHFHIPLQSASDKILNLMHRKYTVDLFASRVKKIKQKIPFACIATDIICGFPNETEVDFDESFNFLKVQPISYMHVFTFSERKGTQAYDMEYKVSSKIKKERSRKLHLLSDQKKMYFYSENKNRICDALFESENHNGEIFGFTDNYIKVKTNFDSELVNKIQRIKVLETNSSEICPIELLK